MNRTLIVEPEAEAEIAEAADWYYRNGQAVRTGFLAAVNKALGFIEENPEQYQTVYRQARRAPLDGYPYAFFYKVAGSQVIVVSCFHTSRDPNVWRERLR